MIDMFSIFCYVFEIIINQYPKKIIIIMSHDIRFKIVENNYFSKLFCMFLTTIKINIHCVPTKFTIRFIFENKLTKMVLFHDNRHGPCKDFTIKYPLSTFCLILNMNFLKKRFYKNNLKCMHVIFCKKKNGNHIKYSFFKC